MRTLSRTVDKVRYRLEDVPVERCFNMAFEQNKDTMFNGEHKKLNNMFSSMYRYLINVEFNDV